MAGVRSISSHPPLEAGVQDYSRPYCVISSNLISSNATINFKFKNERRRKIHSQFMLYLGCPKHV